MPDVYLIAHNLRSSHNVGSLLRTADGLGLTGVYLTGYTPYPLAADDRRLPHIAAKVSQQIKKTALGAENSVIWQYTSDILEVIGELKAQGVLIIALEQTKAATALPDFHPRCPVAIVVGREVDGIEPEVIERCDGQLYIPMFGKKESFNVVQAAAMALYQCRFFIDL